MSNHHDVGSTLTCVSAEKLFNGELHMLIKKLHMYIVRVHVLSMHFRFDLTKRTDAYADPNANVHYSCC